MRKMLCFALGVVLLGMAIGGGTVAWFTSRAESVGNVFSAGILEIGIDPVSAAFQFENMAPGSTKTGSITVVNTGTLDMQFMAEVRGRSYGGRDGADLAEVIDVVVTLADVDGSGQGNVFYQGTLADLIADPNLMKKWHHVDGHRPFSEGMTATFDFQFTFRESAGNQYQGAGWEGEIVFFAEQWNNPNPFPRLGLLAWYDAATDVTVDSDGKVQQWGDKSGRGYVLSAPSTDARPRYVEKSVHGRPSLYFEGEQMLKTGTFATMTVPSTYFVVVKTPPSVDNTNTILGGSRDSHILAAGGRTQGTKFRAYNGRVLDGADLTGEHEVVTVVFNGSQSLLRVSGDETTGHTGNRTIQGISVGAKYEKRDYLTGEISEVLIYHRALTTEEIKTVERYLAEKYSITIQTLGGNEE